MCPDKLIFWFPIHEVKDYRRILCGIDDALVVHRRRRDDWLFELRGRATLGPRSYGKQLLSLAADLEADYTISIIDRDAVLDELVSRATFHAPAKDADAIEAAALTVAERTRHQIIEFLDSDDPEKHAVRYLLSCRKRDASVDAAQPNGLAWQNGIRTPRSEQMWHVTANELLSPNDDQRARDAWTKWARRNRPAMPKLVA